MGSLRHRANSARSWILIHLVAMIASGNLSHRYHCLYVRWVTAESTQTITDPVVVQPMEHHNDHRWQPTHQVPTALAATWAMDINIDTGCYRPRHGCRRLVDKVIKIWENVRNQWVSKNYTNNKQWHEIKSLGKSWGTTGIRSFVQGMLISWKLIFSSVWHQECWPKACFVDIKYFVTVVTFIYDLYIMLSFYIHIWYIYLRSIVKTKNNNTYVY